MGDKLPYAELSLHPGGEGGAGQELKDPEPEDTEPLPTDVDTLCAASTELTSTVSSGDTPSVPSCPQLRTGPATWSPGAAGEGEAARERGARLNVRLQAEPLPDTHS